MSDTEDFVDANPEVDFNFGEWLEVSGLSKKTEKVLRTEDMTDRRTLSLIETRDINALTLTLGQRKLLAVAVDKLRKDHGREVEADAATKERPEVDVNHDAVTGVPDVQAKTNAAAGVAPRGQAIPDLRTAPLLDAGKSYLDILNEGPLDKTIRKDRPQVLSEMDPRAILTVKSERRKALHITDFLTEDTKRRRQSRKKEVILSQSDGDRVVLKTDDKHPYSGILVGEWGAANCRLMNALIERGDLLRDDIEYYLAYTTRIFEYSVKYEWNMVLDYDHQYREMQAQSGFQWGVAAPDMEVRLLAPRQRPSQGRQGHAAGNGAPWRSHNHANTEQPDCRMYLARGYCNFGDKCKYKHPKLDATPQELNTGKK